MQGQEWPNPGPPTSTLTHPSSNQLRYLQILRDYSHLLTPSLTTLLQALPGSLPHSFCVCLAQVHQGLNGLWSLQRAAEVAQQ